MQTVHDPKRVADGIGTSRAQPDHPPLSERQAMLSSRKPA